jgi:hypothetical protein
MPASLKDLVLQACINGVHKPITSFHYSQTLAEINKQSPEAIKIAARSKDKFAIEVLAEVIHMVKFRQSEYLITKAVIELINDSDYAALERLLELISPEWSNYFPNDAKAKNHSIVNDTLLSDNLIIKQAEKHDENAKWHKVYQALRLIADIYPDQSTGNYPEIINLRKYAQQKINDVVIKMLSEAVKHGNLDHLRDGLYFIPSSDQKNFAEQKQKWFNTVANLAYAFNSNPDVAVYMIEHGVPFDLKIAFDLIIAEGVSIPANLLIAQATQMQPEYIENVKSAALQAIISGDVETLKILQSHFGLNLDTLTARIASLMRLLIGPNAKVIGPNAKVAMYKYLLENIKFSPRELNERLFEAIYNNDLEITNLLLDFGADVNCVHENLERRSALMEAAWRGHQNIVTALLNRGANIYQKSNETRLLFLRKNAFDYVHPNHGHLIHSTLAIHQVTTDSRSSLLDKVAVSGNLDQLEIMLPENGVIPSLAELKHALNLVKYCNQYDKLSQLRQVEEMLQGYIDSKYSLLSKAMYFLATPFRYIAAGINIIFGKPQQIDVMQVAVATNIQLVVPDVELTIPDQARSNLLAISPQITTLICAFFAARIDTISSLLDKAISDKDKSLAATISSKRIDLQNSFNTIMQKAAELDIDDPTSVQGFGYFVKRYLVEDKQANDNPLLTKRNRVTFLADNATQRIDAADALKAEIDVILSTQNTRAATKPSNRGTLL